MKDKLYEPARHNEQSPAPGMAAVNTFTPEEAPLEPIPSNQVREEKPENKDVVPAEKDER